MTTKLIIKWALLAPISLFMAVFARLLCPILPLFAEDNGYLPEWLWWFQTPFDTLDGDRSSWERHPGTDTWSTYKRRVAWLWRNAAYGFDIQVLGRWVEPTDQITVEGNPEIGDLSGISGTCYRELFHDGERTAFQWFYVKHYSIFGLSKCVRIGFGWKLWNGVLTKDYSAQYWAYFNLFK